MTGPLITIPFVKANACGNDFLIIDAALAPADITAFSRRICDRHTGVGADGVEWLSSAAGVDIQARLINADGSEAEISGNGTRCVAAWFCSQQPREKVVIATGAGPKTCTLTSHHDAQYEFEIAMGEPGVEEMLALKVRDNPVKGIPVSMGNPHYVVFVDEFAPDWQTFGAAIQHHPYFTQGVNIEFVIVRDSQNIEVRFFERGVGETQSSGTGSCASAVATIAAGWAQSPVRVHAQGGTQTVRWDGQVFLRGSAQLICSGEVFV
jgi:diaminopimelate epimerase